jgi:hypothetical protein
MAEPHHNYEQDVQKSPIIVEVADGQLGNLITEKGDSFDLHNLLGDKSSLGGDTFDRLYIRTESGNIYRLNRRGEMINGRLSETQKQVHRTQLDVRALENAKITVGKPFEYGGEDTTPITEIVPTNDKIYQPDYLDSMTKARSTTIYSDFIKMVPIPTKNPLEEGA